MKPPESALPKRAAIKFIVFLGIVSMFGDMTYEGARGITGPYLAVLGASATIVGIVSGFGELIGYALRLVSGFISDRTGRYWAVTIVGYCVNLFAVPLLALAHHWELAAALMIVERAGRAIRTPARDAMLSHAAGQTGLGWGFGLHEVLDQTGAVLGPLIVSAVLYFHDGYETGFAVLAIPAILSITVLLTARYFYPKPRDFDLAPPPLTTHGFPRPYWLYLGAVVFVAAGYADFPLIAFHFEKADILSNTWIPVFYSIAMATDALAALVLGRLYDRIGIRAVIIATIASALTAPFAFFGGAAGAVIGVVLWGIGMGAQESIMRAVIASMTTADRRGTAYGVFNCAYGVAWFAGSVLLGVLYDVSIPLLVLASVLLQATALPILWRIMRSQGVSDLVQGG